MLLEICLVVLVTALSSLYLRWRYVRRYWAQRNVPHFPPHPVFGSLTFLQKQNPGLWMREMYKKFRSPYIGIWCFWRPALVINSPEIARRILIKDSDLFRDRFLSSGMSDSIGRLNLFTVNEPTWSTVRRHLTPVFTASKLRALNDLISNKAKELTERINNDLDRGVMINLRSMFSDYTTDVIGMAAFGVAGDATLTGHGPMKKVTDDIMHYSLFRGLSWSSIFFFPELVDIFRFSFYPKDTSEYFKKIFHAMVKQRGGYEEEPKGKDLLDFLIKFKRDTDKENEEFDEDLIVAQAAIFLQGGFDTSAVMITLVIYELAYHSEAQEKVYKELLEAKEKFGADGLDSTVLAEITYLNCVINETLRLFPPMGWLDRIASKDYQIDEHLTIKAGTPVYINNIAMQVDPDFFPDPEKFDPDRFLPENERNIQPFTYMPFGDGPRSCIGKRFGLQQLRYAFASIILNFKMEPLPNMPKPSELLFEKRGMFLFPEQVLSVKFTPRT